MKLASDLRKALDEALKPDSSGKTTPIQRLTPFLRELMQHLEENETAVLSLIHAIPAIEARIPDRPPQAVHDITAQQVIDSIVEFSKDHSIPEATEAAPPLSKSASGGDSKATA